MEHIAQLDHFLFLSVSWPKATVVGRVRAEADQVQLSVLPHENDAMVFELITILTKKRITEKKNTKPVQNIALNFAHFWFHQSHWCLVTITAGVSISDLDQQQQACTHYYPVLSPTQGKMPFTLSCSPASVALHSSTELQL